jgi:hypothetical protein
MITPESRSLWVRVGAVPGRTRAYYPVSMELLLLVDRKESTLTATFLFRNAKAINWPRLPTPPATATKLFGVDIWKGVLKRRKYREKLIEDGKRKAACLQCNLLSKRLCRLYADIDAGTLVGRL